MELGSGSSSSSASGPSESLNGLKFGEKIFFEDVGVGVQAKAGSRAASTVSTGPPPPAPAKKGRSGVVQGGQPHRCQVEGCNIDLSDAKAYYSRHKVCGMHSKSPKVIVAGLEQRFCQQCSRFHQLPEFDQGKRSCRRRLAGHNERRRKPPAGSLLSTRYGSLSSSIFDNPSRPGGFVVDFSTYPNLTGRDSWPNTASSERGFGNQISATGKFLQVPWQSNSGNPPPNLLQGSTAQASYSGTGVSTGVSSEECYSEVSASSSALSLLSNQPWDSRNQALSLGVNSLVSSNGTTMVPTTMVQSHSQGAATGHLSNPWGFKGNQHGNNSHEVPSDLGLGHISQAASSQYANELEVAHQSGHFPEPHSNGYDSSVPHMHWSL